MQYTWICFRLSAYGSLKPKEKSRSKARENPRPLTEYPLTKQNLYGSLKRCERRAKSCPHNWTLTVTDMYKELRCLICQIFILQLYYFQMEYIAISLSGLGIMIPGEFNVQSCATLIANSVTAWCKKIVYVMWPSNLWINSEDQNSLKQNCRCLFA